jgi:putative solute:sodium symporter small subunit
VTASPPERVRVTGPPSRAGARRPRTRDIDDQTLLGSVLVGSLLRSQLRLAMVTLVPLLVFAAGVPLVFHLAPWLADVRLGGVPLSWIVLGGLVYPFLVLLGRFYIRRAERTERDFAELVEIAERPDTER